MHMDLSKLGRGDLVLLLEISNRSLLIKNGAEMEGLLRELCCQVPTQGVIAGLIHSPSENLKADEIPFINAGFSEEWLEKYQASNYFSCDPIKRARLSGADFLRWSDT